MRLTFIIFCLSLVFMPLYSITVETASLRDFMYGSTDETAYDNFYSRIVEGVVIDGYNQYAPWDRQTNGFGTFILADEEQMENWEEVIEHFMNQEFELAANAVRFYQFPYEVVKFNDTDTGRTYYMLREKLNMEFFDDNGYPDRPEMHQQGSFDYGWGLYVFNPDSKIPIVVNAPHPKDDFITVPISTNAFQDWDARFLMVAGAGREVMWTEQGSYTNGKSLSDPTRNQVHPFNTAYRAFCDDIRETFDRQELSVQIHSFDYTHPNYKSLQIALGSSADRARYPGLPTRDLSGNQLDLINLSPYVIHPANSIGIHDDVLVTDYYAVYYQEHGMYYHHDEYGPLRISNRINLTGIAGPQYRYSIGTNVWNTFDVFSPFFHVEMEELPSIYPQDMFHYRWLYGYDERTQRWDTDNLFTKSNAYYQPWLDAMAELIPYMFDLDDGTPPTPPENLRITLDTGNRLGLRWDRSYDYDFKTYDVLYAQEPIDFDEPNYNYIDRTGLGRLAAQAHTTITFTSLAPDSDYYFAVRARDYNGNVSEPSNIAVRRLGIAEISNLKALGRDGKNIISWRANWQTDNLGFKVLRAEEGTGQFNEIASYQEDESLAGSDQNNQPYEFLDQDVENGITYDYRIGCIAADGSDRIFVDTESAAPFPIFTLYFANQDSSVIDSLQFGINRFANNPLDDDYDIRKPDPPGSNFIFAATYYEFWWFTRDLLREVNRYFDYTEDVGTWRVRIRTDQIDHPISVTLSDNFTPDKRKLYLRDMDTNEFYNLTTEDINLTFAETEFRNYTLYWGNIRPGIDIDDIGNIYVSAGDSLDFSWETDILDFMIGSKELYIVDEADSLLLALFDDDLPTAYRWHIPEDINIKQADLLMKANLYDEQQLVFNAGAKITSVSKPQRFSGSQGSRMVANPFVDSIYPIESVFGDDSALYQYSRRSSDYAVADSFRFGRGYWMTAADDFDYELSGLLVADSHEVPLYEGWNLLPGLLPEDIGVADLIFVINEQYLSYNQAIQFGFIEEGFYSIDNGAYFRIDSIERASAYLLYSNFDDILIVYEPFHRGDAPIIRPDEWRINVTAAFNEFETDEVIIGSFDGGGEGYNQYYDLPKPPRKPTTELHFYLRSDIHTHLFPLMHSEYKPDPDEGDRIRYWDFGIELDPDTDEPLSFIMHADRVPEDYAVHIIIEDDCFRLCEEEPYLYYPEEDYIAGQIRVTKQPPTGADTEDIPAVSYLSANYPNPFSITQKGYRGSGGTNISFYVNQAGTAKIEIFNIRGQRVTKLIDNHLEQGEHVIYWNGENSSNGNVAAGVYFYRLILDDKVIDHRKMLLLK